MENGKEEWVEGRIYIDSLSTVLAEESWKVETKAIHTDDLYSTNVVLGLDGKSVEVVKEVRGKWATLFFSLREGYRLLIEEHIKPIGNEDQGSNSTDKPEGTGQ
jgi:hypothetical protein